MGAAPAIVVLSLLLLVLGALMAFYGLHWLFGGLVVAPATPVNGLLLALAGAVLFFYGIRIIVWAARGLVANARNGPSLPAF